jgi:hypothetical protein
MKSYFALSVLLLFVSTLVIETAAEPCILCLIFLKGLYVGSRLGGRRSYGGGYGRRWGRSAEEDADLSAAIVQASVADVDDCAKSFVCQLNAKPAVGLDALEVDVRAAFGNGGYIDVTKSSAEFDLAALMGRLAGEQQCSTIYARCRTPYSSMLKTMEQTLKQQDTLVPTNINNV